MSLEGGAQGVNRLGSKTPRGEPGQTTEIEHSTVHVPVKRHRGEPGHTRDTRDSSQLLSSARSLRLNFISSETPIGFRPRARRVPRRFLGGVSDPGTIPGPIPRAPCFWWFSPGRRLSWMQAGIRQRPKHSPNLCSKRHWPFRRGMENGPTHLRPGKLPCMLKTKSLRGRPWLS